MEDISLRAGQWRQGSGVVCRSERQHGNKAVDIKLNVIIENTIKDMALKLIYLPMVWWMILNDGSIIAK